jgi:O-acetyl-ADP-ribose deacetylase (regulator of RNase III)
MKEINGNIIDLAEDGTFNFILQGCNCFHTMGSGLAKEINRRIPNALKVDKENSKYGDESKLGTFTYVNVDSKYTLINCYIQHRYGRDSHHRYVEYGSIRSCLKEIKNHFNIYDIKNPRIGIPLIGCGLAGGDWNVVKKIIEDELKDYDYTIVNFK